MSSFGLTLPEGGKYAPAGSTRFAVWWTRPSSCNRSSSTTLPCPPRILVRRPARRMEQGSSEEVAVWRHVDDGHTGRGGSAPSATHAGDNHLYFCSGYSQ